MSWLHLLINEECLLGVKALAPSFSNWKCLLGLKALAACFNKLEIFVVGNDFVFIF